MLDLCLHKCNPTLLHAPLQLIIPPHSPEYIGSIARLHTATLKVFTELVVYVIKVKSGDVAATRRLRGFCFIL